MKIHFKTPPKLRHLCLMAGRMPEWYLFDRNSFHLNSSTIQRFVDYHSTRIFDGKFVFNKKNERLILVRGEEALHVALARESDPDYKRQDITAAFIGFRNRGRLLSFELDDESEEFGRPSTIDFRVVAEYIRMLLIEQYHFSITKEDYDEPKIIIEFRLI